MTDTMWAPTKQTGNTKGIFWALIATALLLWSLPLFINPGFSPIFRH